MISAILCNIVRKRKFISGEIVVVVASVQRRASLDGRSTLSMFDGESKVLVRNCECRNFVDLTDI
jgi:hypothetical protein